MQRLPFDLWRLIASDLLYFTPLLKGKQLVQYPELIRKMSKRAREESKTKICHRGKACPVGRLETYFPKGLGCHSPLPGSTRASPTSGCKGLVKH